MDKRWIYFFLFAVPLVTQLTFASSVPGDITNVWNKFIDDWIGVDEIKIIVEFQSFYEGYRTFILEELNKEEVCKQFNENEIRNITFSTSGSFTSICSIGKKYTIKVYSCSYNDTTHQCPCSNNPFLTKTICCGLCSKNYCSGCGHSKCNADYECDSREPNSQFCTSHHTVGYCNDSCDFIDGPCYESCGAHPACDEKPPGATNVYWTDENGDTWVGECNATCSYIKTTKVCSNECDYQGQTQYQCSGSWRQKRTCGNYDDDPCLEWSSWTNVEDCNSYDCNTITNRECVVNGDKLIYKRYGPDYTCSAGECEKSGTKLCSTYTWTCTEDIDSSSRKCKNQDYYCCCDANGCHWQTEECSVPSNNPPTITLNSPANNSVVSEVVLNATVSDPDDSKIDVWLLTSPADDCFTSSSSGCSFENVPPGTYTCKRSLSSGEYCWRVEAKDSAGNYVVSEIWKFTVQVNHKPTATLIYPPSGSTGVGIPVNLTVEVSDPDGDLIDVYFYNNTGGIGGFQELCKYYDVSPGSIVSCLWGGLEWGKKYEWFVYLSDSKSGGFYYSPSWSFTTNYKPSITSVTDSPDPLDGGESITFNVSWSDEDGNVKKVLICKSNWLSGSGSSVTCGAGAWCTASVTSTSTSGTTSCSYTTSSSDVGTHTYYAFVCDDYVCSSSTSGSFTVKDTIPPSVEFVEGYAPSNGSYVKGSVDINIFASDNKQVKNTTIYIDGIAVHTKTWSAPNVGNFYSWNTTSYSDGAHKINASASDTSGNVGWTETRILPNIQPACNQYNFSCNVIC